MALLNVANGPQTDACTAAIAVRRTGFEGSERRDRTDDFFCRHNGTRVIRDVEVQRSVHHLVRVVGEAVLGELGREAAPREYHGARFTCAGAGSLAGIEDPACGPARGSSGSLPCSLR